MRIDLVYPTLPPALNGIGDYTAHMARALAEQGADVRVFTDEASPAAAIPGVEVVPAFTVAPRSGVRRLGAHVEAHPPDWLILQFEQFSYGRWGLNPFLPLVLRSLRRTCPQTRLALMAHEDYVSATESPQFAVMSLWQRPQFWALGHLSDRVFFSIEPWAQKYQSWFPSVPVEHLPVGSNIPRLPLSRTEARARLQLPLDAFLVGLFGSAHPSRQIDLVGTTLTHLHARRADLGVLYVGASGAAVRRAVPADVPLYDVGPQPAADVSACFAAMDLYLVPFKHGVSTRRGSFLVGLQHEVPTLSTSGAETDVLLREAADEGAFALVPWANADAFHTAAERLLLDAADRAAVGRAGSRFFDATFAWPRLATRLLHSLNTTPAPSRSRSQRATPTAPPSPVSE
jgi:glycosyltransferase involved in cell wall biosynthesis